MTASYSEQEELESKKHQLAENQKKSMMEVCTPVSFLKVYEHLENKLYSERQGKHFQWHGFQVTKS